MWQFVVKLLIKYASQQFFSERQLVIALSMNLGGVLYDRDHETLSFLAWNDRKVRLEMLQLMKYDLSWFKRSF